MEGASVSRCGRPEPGVSAEKHGVSTYRHQVKKNLVLQLWLASHQWQ